MLPFRSLDPFRPLREPDRRRRDEERLSRSEQRTANKPKDHLTGKAPYRFESISLQQRVYEHRFEHESPYGRVAIDWHLDGDLPKVRTATPVGTTAELSLPDGSVMELAPGIAEHSVRMPISEDGAPCSCQQTSPTVSSD